MFSHVFAALSLVCVLTVGLVGSATAYDGNRWGDRDRCGDCGWSNGRWNSCGGHKGFGSDPSAPELNPTFLGSGAAILAGGMILLNERRRNRK